MIYSRPKVSVCIVTYNHEKYIRDCLQSLVDQKTNFVFEIIVGEDCSKDGTKSIIEEFANNYPDLVKPIYRDKNVGPAENYYDVHSAAKGEYIAHLDGDDYALPGKLQAQADFLDSHPNCNIVWHRVQLLDSKTGEMTIDYNTKTKTKGLFFSRKEILLIGSIGCHSSKMYRSICVNPKFRRDDVIDFYLDVQHVASGYAYVLDDWYGVYRKNVGLSLASLTNKRRYISHLNEFLKTYPEFRGAIAANAFLTFIVDIKNGRETWMDALKIWIKVNPIHMFSEMWRLYTYVKLFRPSKR